VQLVDWLNRPEPEKLETIRALNDLVFEHRLVVFRNQGIVPGNAQVEVSTWFNPLESTFYKHPKSPHPDVFRVSNESTVGCTGVGRTGWHVDGSFQPSPFSHALYHIVSVPKKGATVFLPLEEFLDGLEPAYRAKLESLSMMSDRRSMYAKPVVYKHPKTDRPTMCFHLGMISAFLTKDGRMTDRGETILLLDELEEAILRSGLIYQHDWREGDFIISDNCAVAHEATPETQLPVEEVGLRIMHRTTTQGWAWRH
jgi:taurine dioxygenase